MDNNREFRFYENKLPEAGDYIMGQITEVQENISKIELLEYGRIEAMCTIKQLVTRANKRSTAKKQINKLKKLKKSYVFVVETVDQMKGYMDVSKNKVGNIDKTEIIERYEKGKKVQTLIKGLTKQLGKSVEWGYENIVWKLQTKEVHAGDIFKKALFDFDNTFKDLELEPNVLEVLKRDLEQRYPLVQKKIRASFNLKCTSFNGVEDMKQALRAGESLKDEDNGLSITLYSSPQFIINAVSFDIKKGMELVKKSLELVEKTMKEITPDHQFQIKEEPKVLGYKDERHYMNMIEELERERDLSDDEEEYVEGMGSMDLVSN